MMESSYPHSLEITTLADVPAGTGLGSSGAFTVSLLKALKVYQNQVVTNQDLANQACHIEIDRLGQPVGKQDQYASALGGINEFFFNKDDTVTFNRLNIDPQTLLTLQENLLMFFTGYSRSASSILGEHNQRILSSENEILKNLDHIKEIALTSRDLILKGNLKQFALCMDDHWRQKLKRSPNICSPDVLDAYNAGIESGAIGGKLVGAGGGGFLMFYTQDKESLRAAMAKRNLRELFFQFDHLGAHVLQPG